jgi:hypothetical protein
MYRLGLQRQHAVTGRECVLLVHSPQLNILVFIVERTLHIRPW